MPQKHYTLMIMPAASSRIYRWTLPKWLLTGAGITAGVAFIVVALLVYKVFFSASNSLGSNTALLQENGAYKVRLHTFAQSINGLKLEMLRLQAFDKKLRVITAFGRPDRRPPFIGIGGPTHETTLEEIKKDPFKQRRLMAAMQREIERLSTASGYQEESFKELEKFFADKRALLVATPSIWPSRGWITSTFGYRTSPFTGLREMHEGIDIAGTYGVPIVSPANGVVSRVGYDAGYGKIIEIDHGYGVRTRYGHTAKVLVKLGQRIERGDEIAKLGNSGRSTGPHVHYEVLINKIPVNPMKYILEDDVHTIVSGLER